MKMELDGNINNKKNIKEIFEKRLEEFKQEFPRNGYHQTEEGPHENLHHWVRSPRRRQGTLGVNGRHDGREEQVRGNG